MRTGDGEGECEQDGGVAGGPRIALPLVAGGASTPSLPGASLFSASVSQMALSFPTSVDLSSGVSLDEGVVGATQAGSRVCSESSSQSRDALNSPEFCVVSLASAS